MDADLIAALERAAVQADAAFQGTGRMLWRSDALLIRAHIETLRNGGERAQIVAFVRQRAAAVMQRPHDPDPEVQAMAEIMAQGGLALALAVEAGAHRGDEQ